MSSKRKTPPHGRKKVDKVAKLLENIVSSGHVDNTDPKDVWEMHKEFKKVPLKNFRDRLYRARKQSAERIKGKLINKQFN